MSLYEHYDSELNKRSPWVVTPLDLYMKLMLILPITTLFQNYFDAVNKIVFMIFFIVGLYLITRNLWRNQFIYLVVALVSYIIVYMNSADKSFGNDKVYFISWIIYASYVAYNKVDIKTWLEDNEIFVRSIIKIWTILVVVSIPLSSSWFTKEGSGRYFGSYVQSSFRLCPTALFICDLVLISISLYGRRRDIAYMILPLFCGVMGTSRTYAIVLIFVFMIGVYLNARKKTWTFALRMLPVAIVGLGVYSYTSIADKVSYTMDDSQYGDFWYRITSSRSVIWEKQLEAFSKLTMIKKILGGGSGLQIRAQTIMHTMILLRCFAITAI